MRKLIGAYLLGAIWTVGALGNACAQSLEARQLMEATSAGPRSTRPWPAQVGPSPGASSTKTRWDLKWRASARSVTPVCRRS